MSSSKSTTIELQRYYRVTKTSPTPLRSEDIHVEVNQTSPMSPAQSDQPNFIALALLWAHYEACRQGSLSEAEGSPWEIADAGDSFNSDKGLWITFLRNLITDKTWMNWIQDPVEVKRRTLEAFAYIQSSQDADDESDSPDRED